ncbi:DUF3947 family protein [Bacillus cereus]|uniref:DUF3947 family protein n=1 Tax=Bacillus cereus group TaxID=86661 RepID=UPI0003162DEC|nr:DUF3947 family protein [Bacillus cereus]AJH63478.1 hypothetical protein BG11_1155 [Bacillus cereus]AJK33851.1 hypothetical protein BF33_1742 [Bacillus cereus]KWU66018.1 hypothetical protein AWW71_06800 [Bacillus cereus]MDQ4437475.1 DUF3947 family protein [Bacillus cereus]QKH69254.1 DUF3947 family protein [Bacillus cereus]
MLYSNISNQIRVHSHGAVGTHAITHSAAHSTVQAVHQALQMQQQMYESMQPYYISSGYYTPTVISGEEIYFSIIPYGTVYDL